MCVWTRSGSGIAADPRRGSRPLDDDGRRLDDRGRADAGLELELVGALARHERDDPLAAAGDLDLRHDLVALDRDDRAGEPVAGARAARAGALGQEARELGGVDEALVAAALERHAPVALPAAQRVDAHAERARRRADADEVIHARARAYRRGAGGGGGGGGKEAEGAARGD